MPTTNCVCETFGGHAYKFCSFGREFTAAQADCVAQGMRLVRIDSDAENKWVYTTKNAKGFMSTWIGASDGPADARDGDWRWTDNVPFWTGRGAGSPVGGLFNAWNTGAQEPNQNGNEDCAGYWYMDETWADLGCTDANKYVCEAY